MPLNPNIILAGTGPKIPTYADRVETQSKLQDALQQNQMNQLKIDAYNRQNNDAANLKAILSATDPNNLPSALIKGGFLKEGTEYQKSANENLQANANLGKTNLDIAKAKNDAIGQAMGFLKDNPSDDNLKSTLTNLVNQGIMKPEEAQQAYLNGPKDPDGIRTMATQHFQSAIQANLQLPQTKDRSLGGTNQVYQVNPVTGKMNVLDNSAVTLTPDQIADNTAAQQRQDFDMKKFAEEQRHNKVTEGQGQQRINADNAPDTTNSLISPDAIKAAAERYRIDGTLPTLGMGKTAASIRAQILNSASQMDAQEGVSGRDARVTQIGGKANTSSLTQLAKQKAMVSAFEKNANSNADLAVNASNQLDRTGVPLFNKWLQAGRSGTGSVEANKFNAANETFVNEYAKVMSGSMGNTPVSDSARAHAHSILSTANTKEQYKGTIDLLKQEMANRMQGFDDEEQTIRDSMKGTKQLRMPATNNNVVDFGSLK